MDERIVSVLKEVAYGGICSDDGWSNCMYGNCDASDIPSTYGYPIHDAACTVTLARQLLKEQGMPILLYRIDSEYYASFGYHKWIQSSPDYRVAFDEQEVHRWFPEDDDLANVHNHRLRRNVQLTLIGEAQEVLR